MVDIVDLLRLSSLVPLLNQGHLELVAQDHAWSDLKNLNKWRLQNLLGQPVPVLDHLHSQEVLPDARGGFLGFCLCPLPLVLSLGTI